MKIISLYKKYLFLLLIKWNNLIIKCSLINQNILSLLWFPKEFNKKCKIVASSDCLIYIPWIEDHTNILIKKIAKEIEIPIVPFDLFSLEDFHSRAQINRFVYQNEQAYRFFIQQFLLKNKLIKGALFTFDWLPTMRIIVEECKKQGIPTILIPHEGVFLDKDKYYWDEKSGVSCPSCDYVLGWGNLQKQIFCSRGYPEKQFFVVGSPKLDECVLYRPNYTKAEFCAKYNFDVAKPIILFACQFLDIQIDYNFAQSKQNEIINDLIEYCNKNDCQLIIRMPPNGIDILSDKNKAKVRLSHNFFIDSSQNYLSSVNESIYYASLVCSINSTMLFEAVLMGRNSLAIHYFDVNSPWGIKLIPTVSNKEELVSTVTRLKCAHMIYDNNELKKVANLFGVGSFDGKSAERIKNQIKFIVDNFGR